MKINYFCVIYFNFNNTRNILRLKVGGYNVVHGMLLWNDLSKSDLKSKIMSNADFGRYICWYDK